MRGTLARPTPVTTFAGALTLASVTATAGFLLGRYELIPSGIPIHWKNGRPDMFMQKTLAVVFMPLWTQLILAAVIGAVAALLLHRARGAGEADEHAREDRERMLHGAEGIALLGMIWIAFQAVTAWGVTELWLNYGGGMGRVYNYGLVAAVALSFVVGVRAALAIGRPGPRNAENHGMWRMKALYVNTADPALFVPARYGYGLTLNFGRPIAIAIMLAILLIGLGGPFLLARSLLR